MQKAKLYSDAEVVQAKLMARMDPFVMEVCQTLQNMYLYNLPSMVSVHLTGGILMSMNGVQQKIKEDLVRDMQAHLRLHYPALETMNESQRVGGDAEWLDPIIVDPPKGEYLVITDDEYCIKAVYFGGQDWQCNEVDLKGVKKYTKLPAPPPDMHYVSAK